MSAKVWELEPDNDPNTGKLKHNSSWIHIFFTSRLYDITEEDTSLQLDICLGQRDAGGRNDPGIERQVGTAYYMLPGGDQKTNALKGVSDAMYCRPKQCRYLAMFANCDLEFAQSDTVNKHETCDQAVHGTTNMEDDSIMWHREAIDQRK